MAADSVSLGMFNLTGIPPAPRGVPQIEVTFDIDANGILNVSAKDMATGKEAKITITANTKLSKEEIEKLKKESEQFADADKKKREEVEVKNEADNLVYAADKLVKQDLKDKIKPEQADKINKAAQVLKEALSSNNIDSIKTKTQELKTIIGEVSTEVYRTAGATPGPAGPTADASTAEASSPGTDQGASTGGGATSTAPPPPS
jgi:molecular chaperone DnaK